MVNTLNEVSDIKNRWFSSQWNTANPPTNAPIAANATNVHATTAASCSFFGTSYII
jgi:hypothetical protein